MYTYRWLSSYAFSSRSRTRARQRSPLRISEELLPPGQRRPNIPEMPPPLNHHLSPCVTNVSMGSYYDYVEKVKSAIRKSYSKSEVEESPGCMIQTFAKEMHINVTSLREQLCRTVIRVTGAAKTGKTSLCAGIPQALHAHYQGKKRNWSKRRYHRFRHAATYFMSHTTCKIENVKSHGQADWMSLWQSYDRWEWHRGKIHPGFVSMITWQWWHQKDDANNKCAHGLQGIRRTLYHSRPLSPATRQLRSWKREECLQGVGAPADEEEHAENRAQSDAGSLGQVISYVRLTFCFLVIPGYFRAGRLRELGSVLDVSVWYNHIAAFKVDAQPLKIVRACALWDLLEFMLWQLSFSFWILKSHFFSNLNSSLHS